MTLRERITTQEMGPAGVSADTEASRLQHEASRAYREAIGQFRARVNKFREELASYAKTQTKTIAVEEVIAKFETGEINYEDYLKNKDIIFNS